MPIRNNLFAINTEESNRPDVHRTPTSELRRVKLRAALEDTERLQLMHTWLDRWKPQLALCVRSGGVWDERFTVVVHKDALMELPQDVVSSMCDEEETPEAFQLGERSLNLTAARV